MIRRGQVRETDLNYCAYGHYYEKHTTILTNFTLTILAAFAVFIINVALIIFIICAVLVVLALSLY